MASRVGHNLKKLDAAARVKCILVEKPQNKGYYSKACGIMGVVKRMLDEKTELAKASGEYQIHAFQNKKQISTNQNKNKLQKKGDMIE